MLKIYFLIICQVFFTLFASTIIFDLVTDGSFDPDYTPHFIIILTPVLIITAIMIESLINKKTLKEIFTS